MEYLWAPPAYRWTDLLNSDSHDYRGSGRREDRIDLDGWLGPFLELCGQGRGRLLGTGDREALRQFRSELAKLVAPILAGSPPSDRELRTLNRYLALAESRPVVEASAGGFEIRERPSRKGVEGLIGFLARNLAETLAHGELDRIKLCANPDCRWVMYDESRNKSRRWCEVNACGNLLKVRDFRQRRAAARKAAGTGA